MNRLKEIIMDRKNKLNNLKEATLKISCLLKRSIK